jgi:hypothetical protein
MSICSCYSLALAPIIFTIYRLEKVISLPPSSYQLNKLAIQPQLDGESAAIKPLQEVAEAKEESKTAEKANKQRKN